MRALPPCCLVVGAICGVAGTFASSESMRGLLWGIDGTVLVVGAALLAVHHLRHGTEIVATGFLVFVAGQALVLATAALDLETARPVFGAGTALWSGALILVGLPPVMPAWVRVVGGLAAALFLVVAARCFLGHEVTALSKPLPFFAYPAFAITLCGWAWQHYRTSTQEPRRARGG